MRCFNTWRPTLPSPLIAIFAIVYLREKLAAPIEPERQRIDMIRKCRQKKTAGNQLLLKYRAGIPSERRYLATVRRLMWMPWFARCSAISRSLIAFESLRDWSSSATASLAGAAAVCHRSITIERSLKVPRGVFTYLRQSARTITVLDIWVACIRYSTGTRDGWLDWLARYGVSEAMRASPSFASVAVRSAMASSIHRTLVTSARTCFLASGSLRADDTTTGSIASLQAGPGTA